MNNKAKGTRREHDVMRLLIEDGWVAMRAPASIGPADIIALKKGERPRMIQVKGNRHGGAYKTFGPQERAELRAVAAQAGAVAELVWWPTYGKPCWYDEAIWPS